MLLDIGGDIGALVVTMPATMLGEEVEILTGRDRTARATTARTSPWSTAAGLRGSVPSLVFPELVEGSYALVPKGTDDVRAAGQDPRGRGHHGRLAGLTSGIASGSPSLRGMADTSPADGVLVEAETAALAAAGDPDVAAQQQAYMKSAMPYHGLTVAASSGALRPLLTALGAGRRAQWESTVRHPLGRGHPPRGVVRRLAVARHRSAAVARPGRR